MNTWVSYNGEIEFHQNDFKNRNEVRELIDDNKKDIESMKLEMAMLAAGRAADLIGTVDQEGNEIDIPMALRWKLEEIWDRMEKDLRENWKLESLLENWVNRYDDLPNTEMPRESFGRNTPIYTPPFHPENAKPFARPIEPDDMNPTIICGRDSDIHAPIYDPAQLKLDFDASIEESPNPTPGSLGSLNNPHSNFSDTKL